jgi:hypothetical protein
MGRGAVMGGEEDEAVWLSWAARAEECGTVAAATESPEGGGGLAFGRRKEKRERAEKGQVGLGFDGPQEKQVDGESCSGLEMDWADGPKNVSVPE